MITDVLILSSVLAVAIAKIAARAFQQLNVVHKNWISIIPNSYIMGYMEIYFSGVVVYQLLQERYLFTAMVGFMYGTGGWIGCWFAMWLHSRLHPSAGRSDPDVAAAADRHGHGKSVTSVETSRTDARHANAA